MREPFNGTSAHSENRTEREKDAGLSLAKAAEWWRARWGFSSLSPASFKLPEAQSEVVERHSAMGANLKKLMLAASIAASFLSACGDKAPTPPAGTDEEISAVALQPNARCIAPETVEQLKTMAFDAARRLSTADPVRMNDLQRQSIAKLEMPLLNAHDKTLDRTTCSGRLRIEVPVGARSLFGPDDLVADVTYSMQPAADGTGLVYQVDQFGRIPGLIGYADLSQFNQSRSGSSAPATAPSLVVQQPSSVGTASFDCRRARTSVEQMICADPGLGELDRQMAAAYARRRQAQPGSGSEQTAWIAIRNTCSDTGCLYKVYEDRIDQLSD